MLRSHWGILLAVGLAFAAVSSAQVPQNSARGEHQNAAQNEAAAPPTAALNEGIQSQENYQAPCDEGEDRRDSDLCAQWKAANAAAESVWYNRWQLAVGTAGAVGIVVALLLALWSNLIARTGIKEARQSDKTAQRAWVKFRIEARYGPREYKDGMLRFSFKGELTNIGQTPAIDVTYFPMLCFENPEEKFSSEIEKMKRKPLDWTGSPILPGDEYPISFTANVDEEARQAAGVGKSGLKNGSLVFVIMVVQYRTIHDRSLHFTAGLFRLIRTKSLVDAIDFDGRSITEGDLMLRRYQEGPGYID